MADPKTEALQLAHEHMQIHMPVYRPGWNVYDAVAAALAATSAPAQPSDAAIRATIAQAEADFVKSFGRIEPADRDVFICRAALALATSAPSEPAEPLFLIVAGGDNISTEIVPQSQLDEAYLLTQWSSLDPSDADQHREALEHFHDPDEWQYMDPLRGGEGRIATIFSLNLEGDWVSVYRLPDAHPAPSAAQPVGVRSASRILPTYFVQHPDGSYTPADPQPEPIVMFTDPPVVEYTPPGPLQWEDGDAPAIHAPVVGGALKIQAPQAQPATHQDAAEAISQALTRVTQRNAAQPEVPAELSDDWRAALDAGQEMLEEVADDADISGNCSRREGARASAYVIRQLLSKEKAS